MKKLISLLLALSIVMALAFSMVSCLNNREEEEELLPNSDPYKAKENLEANGYVADLEDDANSFEFNMKAILSATLNGDEEVIMIYYFDNKSDAEYAWDEQLEDKLESAKDNLNEDLADRIVIKRSGKMIFIGTEKAIKATNKKPAAAKPDDNDGDTGNVNADEGRDEFISEIGGVSDTYQGAVSKESYSTADEAARDFVSKEIVGENDYSIESTTSKGELSSSEINKLNLPADVSEGMQSVEKLEVEYTVYKASAQKENNGQVVPLASNTVSTNQRVVVYVIKYEHDWKYFSPVPVTGDTISKSYYDSVFNSEKYENCTLTTTSQMYVDMQASGQGQNMSGGFDITVTQIRKYADGRVYFEQIIDIESSGEFVGMESSLGFSEGTLYAYMEEDEYGTMQCYVKQGPNADWVRGYLYNIGFGSLEDLTPFSDHYLDYTYFTKSDFGFTLQDENAQQYIDKALSQLTSLLQGDGWDFDMYAEYYVSDGVLSGMRTDVEITLDMSQQGVSMSMIETLEQNVICTDYGTTVVEKPFK